MSYQFINNARTGAVIFAGRFDSRRACLEKAVAEGVCLDFADLSRSSLVCANLDGASLRHACFAGANLMGCNLTDARMDGADFRNAGLQGACLCESSLRGCDFTGALFGATDIAGADISHAVFSTMSALMLNFRDCVRMEGCVYRDEASGAACEFSRPPLCVSGLAQPLVFMDRHLKIGPHVGLYGGLRPEKPLAAASPAPAAEFVDRIR